jgi:hypothetical protein
MHPAQRRCESSQYLDITPLSRLAERAPQHLKYPTYFYANPKLIESLQKKQADKQWQDRFHSK